MQGTELVEKILELLVEMTEYCINKTEPEVGTKCSNCALHWYFSLTNHGCFLVETMENNDKFTYDLANMLMYNNMLISE